MIRWPALACVCFFLLGWLLRGPLDPVTLTASVFVAVAGAAAVWRAARRDPDPPRDQHLQAQKLEVIGLLASGIAHDLSNLLTVIGGYGGLVLHDLPPGGPLPQWVREIVNTGERAAALTRQLLAFSRQTETAPTVTDMNALVVGVRPLLARVVGEGVVLETDLTLDPWPVKADVNQLEQVLLNLAINARDAMPDGGTLRIATANGQMTDGRPCAEVTVTDTGVGMDPATQARAFEPFFTTKEVGRGTGLGLSTVLGLVRQADGTIDVQSVPGAGTTIRVRLPRTNEPPPVAADAEATTAATGYTLLLVEDDASVRGVAGLELVRAGFDVLSAGSGSEALAIASGHCGPIHLLLTDLAMPGLTGRQVAEALAPARPETKVLYMSGHTNDRVVRHGVSRGTVAFLQKPFTPAMLVKKVLEVLTGH